MNTVPDWMPTHYAGWRECITMHCGIPLTPDYVAERLKILSQAGHEETQRFIRFYGEDHWQRVIGWFQQAANEVSQANQKPEEIG